MDFPARRPADVHHSDIWPSTLFLTGVATSERRAGCESGSPAESTRLLPAGRTAAQSRRRVFADLSVVTVVSKFTSTSLGINSIMLSVLGTVV